VVESPIPADVQQFILKYIDSIAQLEALLLLRMNAGQAWCVDDVAQRLYISEKDAAPLLMALGSSGLVVAEEREPICFRYAPETQPLEEMVTRVAEVYSKHLVPVTNLVHAKPRTRIQEFADAFKLKRDD
jgi:hypothetical protein